ncbi:DUF1697 domain-containing protein [Microbacterium rhizosphaerae]|uniref:DUF1697 domain-containing protein n=1 Tax=Microbacterium rhizosphaerae TaxID=1678237 RepID=A0ABZ0SHT6_9MICO|nr:DUF1697 domain-containing protein [Microbacterium rhizosphaerae]WPR88018.1 DUF1697 domain-containing protein [Microbacterium rhizosphaerae]
MTAWVALLRGVNVNGVTVRSAELADLFRELGFESVRTVLASGNVAFATDVAASARTTLKARIETALRERFGYDAWILLPTLAELAAVVEAFPFDETDAARQPYAIFCVDDATRDEIVEAAASFDEDADPVASGDGVVYWNPRVGTTVDTPLGKLLGRARFKPSTTARNLRTLRKIIG